jgi:RNA polymerase sigma-70 factor (ECF subfamily)
MDQDIGNMIRCARHDRHEALSELMNAYQNYLRVLAQVWVPERIQNRFDPSDLVQETLLKASRGFNDFQGVTEAELTSWLRRILSRALIDVVRKHDLASREISLEQFDGSGERFLDLIVESGTSPSQAASRRELGVLLADALARLSERQRQLIILRSLKELDWTEVAANTGTTISSARAMWLRALSRLRLELGEIL